MKCRAGFFLLRGCTPLLLVLCLGFQPAAAVEDEAGAESAEPASENGGAGRIAADVSAELLRELPREELQWLEAESGRFPVLLRKEELGDSRGGVILLHGYHRNLDWPVVIRPLRRVLSAGGWYAVSVPLPASPPTAELAPPEPDPRAPPPDAAAPAAESADGAAPAGEESTAEAADDTGSEAEAGDQEADYRGIVSQRILAAVKMLNAEGQFNVVLLGHESGANWALDFFRGHSREVVAGLVLIDARNRVAGLSNQGWFLDLLEEEQRPVLDLAGADARVLEDARDRAAFARRNGLPGYRFMQRVTPAAGLPGTDPDLSRVRAWLEKNVRREVLRGPLGRAGAARR